MTYLEALRQGMREEMERDERVFILGEAIGIYGGAFKVTEGLIEEFGPNRVIDTPISEAAIVGDVPLGGGLSSSASLQAALAWFLIQLKVVCVTLVWSGVVSFVAYKIVDLAIGLRVTEEEEREGLDITSHGETAYAK